MEKFGALLRISAVRALCGLSRSSLYRLMSQQAFPVPIRISRRAVAWKQTDIENWIRGKELEAAARPIRYRPSATKLERGSTTQNSTK